MRVLYNVYSCTRSQCKGASSLISCCSWHQGTSTDLCAWGAQHAKRPRALPEWWHTRTDLELLRVAHRRGFYHGSRKNPAAALLSHLSAHLKPFFEVRSWAAGTALRLVWQPLAAGHGWWYGM